MSKQRHPEDELPTPLRQYMGVLKEGRPLSAEVEARLQSARQAALKRFAEKKKSQDIWGHVLAWASFGHPRMLGAAALSVCLVMGVMVLTAQNSDDAMLLSADLPLEAFADNGFEPWHYSDQI